MSKNKEHLFSVTASDCEFKFQVGRGNGGQNKQKTNSACHCKHKESGASGYAEDSRSQHDNKRLAFQRMVNTPVFQKWLKLEISRRSGEAAIIDEKVDRAMSECYIRTEVKNDSGRWEEKNPNELV